MHTSRRLSLALLCTFTVVSCSKELSGPAPQLTATDPNIVCVEQLTTTVKLTGSGLSPLPVDTLTESPDLVLPKITLVRETALDGSSASGSEITVPDDPQNEEASRVTWTSQAEMSIEIFPELELEPGVFGIRVDNENGNSGTFSGLFVAIPPPELDAVEPDLICNAEGTRSVDLVGENFLFLAGETPAVMVGDTNLVPVADDANCTELPAPAKGAKLCNRLTIEVPMSLAPDTYAVSVQNPNPAGCVTETTRDLFIVPPPTVTDIEPVEICLSQGETTLMFTGMDLLEIDGVTPMVTFASSSSTGYTAMPASGDLMGCTDMAGPTETVRNCTGFTVTLPEDPTAVMRTVFDVTVTNPDPAGCSSDPIQVTNFPPPQVTAPSAAMPAEVCQGGGSIFIEGLNLRAGAEVSIWEDFNNRMNGVTASNVEPTMCDADGVCTEIRADFGFLPMSLIPTSPVDLVVGNIDGCESAIVDAITLTPGPLAVAADPSVIYDGFDNTVTVYVANFPNGGPITRVELIPPSPDADILLCEDGNANVPDCSDIGGGGRSGAFIVNIPGGVLSTLTNTPTDATFSLRVGTNASCDALLVDGIRIVSVTTPATLDLVPGFGKVGESTPVSISMTEGLFVATPRAYLTNPNSGGGLRSVAFVADDNLTAIVPANFTLSCGTDCFESLDLTVVNPTGEVFVKPNAFTLSTWDPPIIDDVTPGQIPGGTAAQIQVSGQNFSDQPNDPTAALVSCQDAAGNALPDVNLGVTYIDSQNLTLSLASPGVPNDSVCLVEVTNVRDGAFDRYSAVVFANPSGNIPTPRVSPFSLNTARRAHGMTAVGATRAARFLYVSGGDNGAGAARPDIEYAPLSLTGEIGQAFRTTRYSMSAPRTRHGLLRAGRALYAIGGVDGQGAALDSVERAVVLDPEEAPEVSVLDFDFGLDAGANRGLAEGAWIYQVATVFANNDPINPCGESLPSDPFVINIPDVTNGLVMTLAWTDGSTLSTYQNRVVAGYRVYRTPMPDAPLGDITFLNYVASATITQYFDNAQPVTNPAAISGCQQEPDLEPLALGETSRWVSAGVPQLNTARVSAGYKAVVDKGSDNIFLYVMSGLDGQNGGVDSYEHLVIAHDVTSNPTVWEMGQSWNEVASSVPAGPMGACAGPTARSEAGLFSYQRENSSLDGITFAITNAEQYLFFGPGRLPNGGMLGVFQSWLITPVTGVLDPASYNADCRSSAALSGYGNIGANRQVFTFGGDSASPDGIYAVAWDRSPGNPPSIQVGSSYNNNGNGMNVRRFLHGTVLDRAFIYLVGGDTLGNGVTDSVEYGVW